MSDVTNAWNWTGTVHAESLALAFGVGAAWLAATVRRGARPAPQHALAFAAGLLTLVSAVNGPLHDLSERYLFSAHMVQHLLLTLVVPPLLLAGTPTWMGDALIGRGRRAAVIRAVTRPVPALALYTLALGGWHLPAPYDAALETPAWHVVEHGTLLLTATLAWWPVVGPSTVVPPLHYGAQILYLFAFGLPMTVVAALVTGAEDLVYRFYAAAPRITALGPLEDQRLGGVIMWVPAGLVPLLAFTAVYFRWVNAEREDDGEPVRAWHSPCSEGSAKTRGIE